MNNFEAFKMHSSTITWRQGYIKWKAADKCLWNVTIVLLALWITFEYVGLLNVVRIASPFSSSDHHLTQVDAKLGISAMIFALVRYCITIPSALNVHGKYEVIGSEAVSVEDL